MAYDPIRCDEQCGDGILFTLECDDGNLINGDGCSDVCEVEEGYECMNGSQTEVSVCSYNSTISMSILTGTKNPTSNSLTLTYVIEPAKPIYGVNNQSNDFTSLVSFTNNQGITVTSAHLDP